MRVSAKRANRNTTHETEASVFDLTTAYTQAPVPSRSISTLASSVCFLTKSMSASSNNVYLCCSRQIEGRRGGVQVSGAEANAISTASGERREKIATQGKQANAHFATDGP